MRVYRTVTFDELLRVVARSAHHYARDAHECEVNEVNTSVFTRDERARCFAVAEARVLHDDTLVAYFVRPDFRVDFYVGTPEAAP